jgi:hypothetical protein
MASSSAKSDGGNIPLGIGDGTHTGVLGVTGQVYRYPGNAKADGHFRAEWFEIDATAERVDQPVMSLVTTVIAYRLAHQAAADGKPGADVGHVPGIRVVHYRV